MPVDKTSESYFLLAFSLIQNDPRKQSLEEKEETRSVKAFMAFPTTVQHHKGAFTTLL